MERGYRYWFRWLAVLPGAILAGLISLFPLHWVLYSTLTGFIDPYPELPERLLTPFVSSGVLIWSGSRIAPEFKLETSLALVGLYLVLWGGSIVFVLSGGHWERLQFHFVYGALSPAAGLAGALTGLMVVRKERPTN